MPRGPTFATAVTLFCQCPHPDEPRVVGPGRDRRSRRRSGRERSGPAPISRSRSGHSPAVEGTGSRRAERSGVWRDLVPGDGPSQTSQARLPVVIQYGPLQLTLPTGFDSWAQVLTDWRVSRAFDAVPLPRCFGAEPELAAPFVAAISREICARQLGPRPLELLMRRERVVEPAFDRVCGRTYVELRGAIEAAQWRHFSGYRAECPHDSSWSEFTLPAEVCRMQAGFFDHRRRNAAAVENEQRAVARAYWKAYPRHGIADDFFADAASDAIPARMARVDPMWWWRSFFTRLQAKSKRHHAADGRFLDALPSLRAQATKTTLAVQIVEWSETAAADWGWRGGTHYRRLAEYADRKARFTVAWFEHRAPSYLGTPTLRRALDTRLELFLSELDPHAQLLAAERNRLSEHLRN